MILDCNRIPIWPMQEKKQGNNYFFENLISNINDSFDNGLMNKLNAKLNIKNVEKQVIISRPEEPFIPEEITVHLGPPDQPAENVTLSFPNYIKNVASSEVFPTWPESAIRANIYAQISFALNRIYTEWYRSRGYDFDITNTTQFDQSFNPNGEIFGNISEIVDEIFNSYVVRQGRIEPLFTAYCDGQRTQCEGLTQWGSVTLANEGLSPYEILQHFYGNDINIVKDVPVGTNFESYPLYPLRLGSFGQDVSTLQNELKRIRKNYPSIPEITDESGIFGTSTEAAVKQFQKIFNLTQDGVVGSSTWYKIKYIFNSVKGLGELDSEGVLPGEVTSPFQVAWQEGDSGLWVSLLQYYISILACFYNDPNIPVIEVTGYFGPETTAAVKALQKKYNIIVDGVVGIQTWAKLDQSYKSILNQIPARCLPVKTPYPGYILSKGMGDKNVRLIQTYLEKIASVNPTIPKVEVTGTFDDQTEKAVRALQQAYFNEATGLIGPTTWNKIVELYESI